MHIRVVLLWIQVSTSNPPGFLRHVPERVIPAFGGSGPVTFVWTITHNAWLPAESASVIFLAELPRDIRIDACFRPVARARKRWRV